MKVINRTVWRTDHLRAILQRAAEQELEPAQRKLLVVTVAYTRGGHSSGCAYIGGRSATVRVRHPETRAKWAGPLTPTRHAELVLHVAHVARHEFAHIRGMRHATMPAHYKWSSGGTSWRDYVSWAAGMPLEVKAPKAAPKPTAADKLQHVQRMRRLAETRAKRAATILRKWKAKERYYQRAMAAQGPAPDGGQ